MWRVEARAESGADDIVAASVPLASPQAGRLWLRSCRRPPAAVGRGGAAFLTLAFSLLLPDIASSHESGFGHSKRTLFFTSSEDGFLLDYRIHLAPEEAMSEMAWMDEDRDGSVSNQERDRWFEAKGRKLLSKFVLLGQNGGNGRLAFVRYRLDHGLTQTFSFRIRTDAESIVFEDANLAHRPGVVRLLGDATVRATVDREASLHHAGAIRVRVTRQGGE